MLHVLLIILINFIVGGSVTDSDDDHYWKEYNGKIPLDAAIAGRDEDGRKIYIGQGYYHGIGIVPGTLVEHLTEMTTTAYLTPFKNDKYLKIFCTQNPGLFKWIPVTSYSFSQLEQTCNLVLGGYDMNTVFIGRARLDGKYQVGRVFLYPPRRLCLPLNHPPHQILYEEFEVLTFNCTEDGAFLEKQSRFKEAKCACDCSNEIRINFYTK